MNEFLDQFIVEGRELVAQGNDDLLALEQRPDDRTTLDGAFRAFHTLKGAAGIVDFVDMARALHAAEDVLAVARSTGAPVTPALINLCLASLDQVGAWLDQLQVTGEIPIDAQGTADDLIRRFAALEGTESASLVPAPGGAPADGAAGSDRADIARSVLEAQKLLIADQSQDGASGRLASAARVAANVLRHQRHSLDLSDLERSLQSSVLAADPEAMTAAIDRIMDELSDKAATVLVASGPAQDTTLRVEVGRIDELVRLTGELLIAKNAIGHSAQIAQKQSDASVLAAALSKQYLDLDRLIEELQHSVIRLRVMPLNRAFQRFPRLVREMSVSLAKPARLIIEGAATEADRTIVESIFEPLLHVVRNSLDHGLENAAERKALNKPDVATIYLRAARQSDHVVIEVEDDGRGIDVARVRQVARDRNVVSAELIGRLSDDEAIDLIFSPGFSTASQVTELSGRGVGLDVVRNAVDRLGGRVAAFSRPGRGTVVRFTLPFTVMMTRVLTVESAGQVFGVPFDAVVETLRVGRDAITPMGAAHAVTVRNRTVPVIDLSRALGRQREVTQGDAIVLIVNVDGQLGGLEVERLGDRLDVMLKPPEGLLAGIPEIEGATLLGDGRVLIILDLEVVFANSDA